MDNESDERSGIQCAGIGSIGWNLVIFWSHPPGSNRRPADYESAALPTELGWPLCVFNKWQRVARGSRIQSDSIGRSTFNGARF